MEKIKKIIAILVCLIIITIVAIVLIGLNANQSKNNDGTRQVPTEERQPLEKETNIASFYLIDEQIQNYFSYITNNKQEDNDFLAAYSILSQKFTRRKSIINTKQYRRIF